MSRRSARGECADIRQERAEEHNQQHNEGHMATTLHGRRECGLVRRDAVPGLRHAQADRHDCGADGSGKLLERAEHGVAIGLHARGNHAHACCHRVRVGHREANHVRDVAHADHPHTRRGAHQKQHQQNADNSQRHRGQNRAHRPKPVEEHTHVDERAGGAFARAGEPHKRPLKPSAQSQARVCRRRSVRGRSGL